MTKEQLQKAKDIEHDIVIVDEYINKFNPELRIVWLHVKDQYGNGDMILPLYAQGEQQSKALGHEKFTTYYREFLQKCTDYLLNRKEVLEKSLESI